MHNLHLAVVTADSGKEACRLVEQEVEGFGTENNYFSIQGAVSEKNEVYVPNNEGRFDIDTTINTIEKINSQIGVWVRGDWHKVGLKVITKYIADPNANIKSYEWYNVKKWAEYQGEVASLNEVSGGKIDVLTMSFYPYQYNECGVTQFSFDNDGVKWVVFIDMHD